MINLCYWPKMVLEKEKKKVGLFPAESSLLLLSLCCLKVFPLPFPCALKPIRVSLIEIKKEINSLIVIFQCRRHTGSE